MAFGAAFAVMPAFAQSSGDIRPLLDRLNRLERDLNTLQRQVYRGGNPAGAATSAAPISPASGGGAADGPIAAQLQVRLTDLETQIQDVNGRVEELTHQLSQLTKRFEIALSDLELRLDALAVAPAGTAPASTLSSPSLSSSPPPSSLAAPATPAEEGTTFSASAPPVAAGSTPQEAYDAAWSLLVQGDYAAAEAGFAGFLSAYGNHGLAANARYWLAETYYVRNNYAEAAVQFAESYQKHPKGPKAPDSLLKLGMSLAALDRKEEACETFAELKRQFPQLPPSLKSLYERERERQGCS